MPSTRSRFPLPAALLALALAACSTAPKHPGFYRDDGPPDSVPRDLARVPDAVPRDEPLNPFANRPYVALGRSYAPDTSGAPFRQHGIASWYGRQFQGNRTSSGEPYDMFAMSAAHPTLPIPSYARVTSVKDGRAVIVRINDRGPFFKDRIIDLSYAAAVRLGIAATGSGEVEVERILASQAAPALAASTVAVPAAPVAAETRALPDPPADPVGAIATAPLARPGAAGPAESATATAPLSRSAGEGTGVRATDVPQWSVQLGAFSVAANADALKERLALLLSAPEAASLPEAVRMPQVVRGGSLLRVLVGSSSDRALALQWAQQLERFLARPATLYMR